MPFWGAYSYPYLSFLQKDFLQDVWSTDNTDAYFPRAMAYSASSGVLSNVNDRYLQNIRYMRFKNLTVGYTLPQQWTQKAGIDWSPLKKHSKYVDPEGAIDRSGAYNNAFYPWQKSFLFGIDVTF